MRRLKFSILLLLGLAFAGFTGCALGDRGLAGTGSAAAISGMARVWFFRPSLTPRSSAPLQPFAPTDLCQWCAGRRNRARHLRFYRDFPPGTYRFTVQPLGSADDPGSNAAAGGPERRITFRWIGYPSWTQGYPRGRLEFAPKHFRHSVDVAAGSAGLPSRPLAYLGPR